MSLDYIKSVNKRIGTIVTILTAICVFLFAIKFIDRRYVAIVLICIFLTACYYLLRKKDDKQILLKYINIIFLGLFAFYTMYTAIYGATVGIGLLVLVLISLYYDEKITLGYGILCGVYFIVLGNFIPRDGLTKEAFGEFQVIGSVSIFFTSLTLFFLSKMGLKNLKDAEKERENAENVLRNLEETFSAIKSTSDVLTDNVSHAYEQITSLQASGSQMNGALSNMENGINHQTESISSVEKLIKDTSKNMDSVRDTTQNLVDTVNHMGEIVSDSKNSMMDMSDKMGDIEKTSNVSFTLAQELGEGIKKVSEFLSSIHYISDQTNLLALNASIDIAIVM